jgi:hypothetical protein
VISMVDGFVRIFRQEREHWTYKRSEYFHAWFEMLACAKYTPEPETRLIEGQLVAIGYGEFVFGRTSWSKRLNIPETVLRGLIKKLIKDDMIELVGRYNKCTVYKIKNYEKFNQRIDQQTDQQQIQENQGVKGHDNQRIARRKASKQPAGNHTQEVKESNKKTNIDIVIQKYHDLCPSLPKVRVVTEKRKKLLKARLGKYSISQIEDVFRKAESSDFLSGRSGKWTGCNIDWLLNENNFVKVLEGNYDNKNKPLGPENENYGVNLPPHEKYFD